MPASQAFLRQGERERRGGPDMRIMEATALQLEAGGDVERKDGGARRARTSAPTLPEGEPFWL